MDGPGQPRGTPAIDVVREALALIARGESPGHLQAPDFRFYGSVVGLELPSDGWGAQRALDELAARDVRTRPLVIEQVDDERVYVEMGVGMRSDPGPDRSAELIGALYTVRDGLLVRLDLSPDLDAIRRLAGLPVRDA